MNGGMGLTSADQRGIGRSARRVFGLNGVSNVALLGTAIVTARILGPGNRGALVLYMAVGSFAMLACSLGVNVAERVYLVSPENPIPFGEFLGLGIGTVVLQGLVTVGACGAVLPFAHTHPTSAELVIAGLYGSSSLLALITRDALYGFGMNGRAAAVDALGSVLQFGGVGVAAYSGVVSVGWLLSGFAVANGLQSALTLVIIRRSGISLRPLCTLRIWVRILRTGLPTLGTGLGQAGAFRFDRILLGVLANTRAVGVYSVAVAGTEAIWLAPTALAQVVFHRVASRSASPGEILRVRRRWLAMTAILAAVIFVLAPMAVDIALGGAYQQAVPALRLLLPGAVMIGAYHIDRDRIAACGRTGISSIPAVGGLVMVTALDLAMIPALGINGAAIASTLGYAVMAVGAWRLAAWVTGGVEWSVK